MSNIINIVTINSSYEGYEYEQKLVVDKAMSLS